MSVSIEKLSQPVSEEKPCGENFEYEPQFTEMVTLSQPPQEGVIEGEGDASAEPDWKAVGRIAASLSEETRDLRIQVYATLASIHTGGLPEFRNNLEVLKMYLENFWDTVYPELDPDDGDPMERMSSVQMLNDYNNIVQALARVKLVELKGLGQFGVRQVELAQGKEQAAENEEVPDINGIREAFVRADLDYMETLRQSVRDSLALLNEMVEIWRDKAGSFEGLDLQNAIGALKKVSDVLKEFAPAPSDEEEGEEEAEGEGGGGGGAAAQSGAVNSRADVVRLLDKVCEYYSMHEPSSPIPLLLRRAQRLVEKSFMEILEDIVPDSVTQAKVVSGETDDGY